MRRRSSLFPRPAQGGARRPGRPIGLGAEQGRDAAGPGEGVLLRAGSEPIDGEALLHGHSQDVLRGTDVPAPAIAVDAPLLRDSEAIAAVLAASPGQLATPAEDDLRRAALLQCVED